MTLTSTSSPLRDLHFMGDPHLWGTWPFLPLVRRVGSAEPECGLLFDAQAVCDLTGYRCTVFLSNLFLMPPTVEEFLALPKEVFDNFEEVYAAGWRVD